MEQKTASQGLLIPGDASPDPGLKSPPPAGNTNGLAPDNTERPARKPGEGRKYFSYSQYTKYAQICQENNRSLGEVPRDKHLGIPRDSKEPMSYFPGTRSARFRCGLRMFRAAQDAKRVSR